MDSFNSLSMQQYLYQYLLLTIISSNTLTTEEGGPPHLVDELKDSTMTFDIDINSPKAMMKTPEKFSVHPIASVTPPSTSEKLLQSATKVQTPPPMTAGPHLAGPLLHDDSHVYVYNDFPCDSKSTYDFGAIGDHLRSVPARSSVSENQKHHQPGHHVHHQASMLQRLVAESTPDLDRYEVLRPIEQADLFQATWGMTSDTANPVHSRNSSSSASSITLYRDTQSVTTQDSSSSFEDYLTSVDSEPPTAPVWHRTGPAFASIVKFLANHRNIYHNSMNQLGHSIQGATLHDNLDPEEFTLPYGSLVFSIKSTNIANLYNAIKQSRWSSTLGSNKVLSEAFLKKKPEEKIILLFSVSHKSAKFGNKYLGMAEIAAPLDLTNNAGFGCNKAHAPRGSIPIRWIVAKDVPFAMFQDLTYHEQAVTQVRHGNTIPGEAGRLLVQRYFEAAH